MMPVSPTQTLCAECRAANRAGTQRCWLCGAKLGEHVPYAELVYEPVTVGEGQFSLADVLILVTIVAVIAGCWVQDPGVGFTLTVIVLPALIATFVRTRRRIRRGEAVTWLDRLGTFVIAAAATFGLLMVLLAAAIIALLIFCIIAISGFNI